MVTVSKVQLRAMFEFNPQELVGYKPFHLKATTPHVLPHMCTSVTKQYNLAKGKMGNDTLWLGRA